MRPGLKLTIHLQREPRLHERMELYLYSPMRLNGVHLTYLKLHSLRSISHGTEQQWATRLNSRNSSFELRRNVFFRKYHRSTAPNTCTWTPCLARMSKVTTLPAVDSTETSLVDSYCAGKNCSEPYKNETQRIECKFADTPQLALRNELNRTSTQMDSRFHMTL